MVAAGGGCELVMTGYELGFWACPIVRSSLHSACRNTFLRRLLRCIMF